MSLNGLLCISSSSSYKIVLLHGRDIKGANILVDPHGEIKLADFGMAKHVCVSY